MDGACFSACLIASEGSFQGDEGTRAEEGICEDLVEVGWSAKVGSGRIFPGNCG